MTLVRDTMPHKLFKQLPGAGVETEEIYPGIYELSGRSPFKTQLIITSRLTDEGHAWLKGLTLNGTKEHVQGIIDQIPGLDSKHKSLADTVMNVFTGANTPLMYRIKREDKDMCQAVNELFADEIAELKIELTRQIKINADSKAEAEKAKAEMLAKAKAEVEAEAAKANVYRQQLIEAGITPKD